MRTLKIASLLIIASLIACGGGGGDSDVSVEDIAAVSFDGAYEGSLNRVAHRDDCDDKRPSIYNGYHISHAIGARSLSFQWRTDGYSKTFAGSVTSADSLVVEMEQRQAGLRRDCTSQTTITFEDINESSARVIETERRIGIENCFSFDFSQKPSGSCTTIYEGVLPRK